MITGRRIICFGDEEWDFTGSIQRIARTLAKSNEIIYITSLGLRLPRPTLSDLNKIARRGRAFATNRHRVVGNARVVTPIALPLYHSLAFTRFSAWLVYRQLRHLGIFPVSADTILWFALPTAGPILDFLDTPNFFYYAADRHRAYPGASRGVIQCCEETLARKARFCVASSELMASELRSLNPNSYYVDHGVDFGHFCLNSAVPPDDLARIPRPIIGYLGGITPWVDEEALTTLAARRADWSLVLIGPDYINLSRRLKLPNVYFLGPRSYMDVPRYLAGFDVCLLPRKTEEWELYANPLKILEYFCVGRPIVSSALPQAMAYGSLIQVYKNPGEIEQAVSKALAEPLNLQEQRREIARLKAHPHEVEQLSAYIEEYMSESKIETLPAIGNSHQLSAVG